MVKPGALLLLLAVAASQVDLLHAQTIINGVGQADISSCPITFYGQKFSTIDVSFKHSSAVICFKPNLNDTAKECVVIEDRGDADRMMVTITAGSFSHPNLPTITTTSTCNIEVVVADKTSTMLLSAGIYNFGAQTALEITASSSYAPATVNVTAVFGSKTLRSWSFSKSEAVGKVAVDLSGCRQSGAPLLADSEMVVDPKSCLNVVCSASAVLTLGSSCGSLDICLGDNICSPPLVCTVTGPTLIDFFGRELSVPDRCVYSLMKSTGGSGFELLASFRERRRVDVPFLDYLILSLTESSAKIYLEQGGRVRVNDQVLTLNATAQTFNGVRLSKDQIGVTAYLTSAKATVIFDGDSAYVTGHIENVEGLCGSSADPKKTTTTSAEKSSSHSAAGCDSMYSEPADSSINCNASTEYCNLLSQAPFTVCHSHIAPGPFIKACTETLCKYPSVDGINCQFLEAYATSCELTSDVVLGDWWSKASCSAAPNPCRDLYCSNNEFCGETFGDTSCVCRSIFASKYKATNSLGDPTVCTQNSASLTLAGCLLQEKGIDYTALHLKDMSCTGHMDSKTHMVTFSFDSTNPCGVKVTTNGSQVIYKNTITTSNTSVDTVITRDRQVVIDFSCFYTQPDLKNVAFLIKDSSVVQQIVSGAWNYTLMMNTYTDAGLTQLVGPTTKIGLNQKIWVALKTEGLDDNMVAVVTDSCWATSESSPDSVPRYELITKGCKNSDKTVNINGNGAGTSNAFSFNMFKFAGKSSEIYLHCKLQLCVTQGKSCVPNCSGGGYRKRRSLMPKYANETPAVITMAWSN